MNNNEINFIKIGYKFNAENYVKNFFKSNKIQIAIAQFQRKVTLINYFEELSLTA